MPHHEGYEGGAQRLMRTYYVTRVYGANDPDRIDDPIRVSLTDAFGVILSGDWYHDDIDSQIDGFFVALDHLEIKYERIDSEINDPEADGE